MGVIVKGDVETFYVDATEPVRVNRVQNWLTYRKLVEALTTSGWDGPPVVVIDRDHWDPPTPPLAITGSHRLAAAEKAHVQVPCVDLADLYESRGLDLDELLEEWLPEGEVCSDGAIWRAVAKILDRLPIWLVRHYDIDLIFCPGTAAGRGHRHLCELEDEHYLEDDGWHQCVTCGGEYRATSW